MDLPEPAPRMPSVADYWPDAPGRRPAVPRHAAEPPALADAAADPEKEVPESESPGKVRRTRGGLIALVLLVVVVGVLVTYIRQADRRPAPVAAAPAPPLATESPVPTGPVPVAPAPSPSLGPTRTKASPALPTSGIFEVAATADSVTVRSQNLGTDLYRVTLAKSDDPVRAKIADTGTNHRLTLVKDRRTTAPPVTITLNSGMRWSLKLTAGNTETTADLTQSKLAALELAGGAHVFHLALPPAAGTLPLRVTHGMNQLEINTNGTPVRTTLRVGAGKLILDGESHTDTKPGKVFTSDGWSKATDRIDLDSVEGVGTLTIDTD